MRREKRNAIKENHSEKGLTHPEKIKAGWL